MLKIINEIRQIINNYSVEGTPLLDLIRDDVRDIAFGKSSSNGEFKSPLIGYTYVLAEIMGETIEFLAKNTKTKRVKVNFSIENVKTPIFLIFCSEEDESEVMVEVKPLDEDLLEYEIITDVTKFNKDSSMDFTDILESIRRF